MLTHVWWIPGTQYMRENFQCLQYEHHAYCYTTLMLLWLKGTYKCLFYLMWLFDDVLTVLLLTELLLVLWVHVHWQLLLMRLLYACVVCTTFEQTITQTSVQYVRCLKPNSSKSAVHLENKKVTPLLQLLLQLLLTFIRPYLSCTRLLKHHAWV
jgi:hypothetical protein